MDGAQPAVTAQPPETHQQAAPGFGRADLLVDFQGEALAGAQVTVIGPVSMQALTGEDGAAVLDLPEGLYDIHVEWAGARTVRKIGVVVHEGQTTRVIAVLEAASATANFLTAVTMGERVRMEEGIAYAIAELNRGIAIPTGVRHEPGAGPAVFVDGSTRIAYLPDRAVSDALLGVPGYLPGSGSLGGWSMTQASYAIDGIRVDRTGRLGP